MIKSEHQQFHVEISDKKIVEPHAVDKSLLETLDVKEKQQQQHQKPGRFTVPTDGHV